MTSGNAPLQREYKSQNDNSNMENIYVDIDRKKQAAIITELFKMIDLSSRKFAAALGWNRSSLFLYKTGKNRIPYNRFLDLCRLANVDANSYSLEFVKLNNQEGIKLDLSKVEESQFKKLTPTEWQNVVAAGILTDGHLYFRKFDNKFQMRFFSSDINMHSFFQKTVLLAFGEHCSALLKKKNENLWTTFYFRGVKNPMIQKLLSFTGTYSTTKGNCPSLDFLLNEREEVKIQALRFAMSCDGSISVKRDGRNSLKLACAHPELALQFQQLFKDIGIAMNLGKDKSTWSGIQGLESTRNDSIRRFAEIGGFLPENVKVTNGKRVGLLKNEVLKIALDHNNSPKPL